MIVYIAHRISAPTREGIEANLADIRRIVRRINMEQMDIVPFVPYYCDIVSMDDNVPAERERGIWNDTEILRSGIVDQLWLTGDSISTGMTTEAEMSEILGIPVVNKIGQL